MHNTPQGWISVDYCICCHTWDRSCSLTLSQYTDTRPTRPRTPGTALWSASLATNSHLFMSRFPYFLETLCLYFEKYGHTSVLPANFRTTTVKYRPVGRSVTGMTQPRKISTVQAGIEPWIFHSRGGCLNHMANKAALIRWSPFYRWVPHYGASKALDYHAIQSLGNICTVLLLASYSL